MRYFLVVMSLVLLLGGGMSMPLNVGGTDVCIARQYPQADEQGNVLLVSQWCDGRYTWEIVGRVPVWEPPAAIESSPAAPAAEVNQPAGLPAGQPTNGNQVTVPTKAQVVSPEEYERLMRQPR